jgi:hypothetical protein
LQSNFESRFQKRRNRFYVFMKKFKEIVGILIVVLITLCSCTTETIEQAPMLKRIVEVSVDGSSNTTTLNYNGNKIATIDKVDAFLEFYYTGDLITKIVEFTKSNSQKNTLEYSYSDGKLTKIISSDNYVINYVHNTDSSISYEKLTKDANNLEVKIYHGILYFQNGNLSKDERIFDNTGQGVLVKNTVEIAYDAKKNVLNSVLGFNKLLDYSKVISANNAITNIETSSVKNAGDDQVTSSIKRYDSQYEYNSNGYPTEIVSEKIIFGGSDSKHLKSQLFYN